MFVLLGLWLPTPECLAWKATQAKFPIVKRIWVIGLAVVGFVGLVGVAGFCWLLSDWEIEDISFPYSHVYSLGKQGKVFVTGKDSGADFQGDFSTSYQIELRLPHQKREVVGQGSRINQEAPKAPFRLLKTKKMLYLTNETAVYYRPINGKEWNSWTFGNQPEVRFLGRALMPDRYARNEKFPFEQGFESPEELHRLPEPPLYTFERFGPSENIVVMRQMGSSDYSVSWAVHTPSNLWPARLVFNNWQLDVRRTLTLNKRKLRPFPSGVTMELIRIRYPAGTNWRDKVRRSKNGVPFTNYDLVGKVPGAKFIKRELLALTPQYQPVALAVQPEKIQIHGLCADPNRTLVHFLWKEGAKAPERWAIAHKAKRWSFFGGGSSVIFARMNWK